MDGPGPCRYSHAAMIPEEVVTFGPPGGPDLRGVLAIPPTAARGVVVCHPHPLYGGDMDSVVVRAMAGACLDAGLAALRFDFRGVRGSGGAHDGIREQDDVHAALDLIERRLGAVPALAGYSFGAAMAAAVAASGRRLAGVALVAPPGGPCRPSTAPCPFLVVAGSQDHVCPAETLRAWRSILPEGSVEVLSGADHFFADGLGALHGTILAWARQVADGSA